MSGLCFLVSRSGRWTGRRVIAQFPPVWARVAGLALAAAAGFAAAGRRHGVSLGIEPLDGLDERQALERPLDLGPVAHDQDRHVRRRDVLARDAIDVGLGDGFDPLLIMGELIVGQVIGRRGRAIWPATPKVVSNRLGKPWMIPCLAKASSASVTGRRPVMSVSSFMISTSDSLVTAV